MQNARISKHLIFVTAMLLLPLIAATSMSIPGRTQQAALHDHDQDPIKAGYAVITPTSAATEGLVVFATFGERHGTAATQAGVLPSEMTEHAMLFVSTCGRLSRNLGVAIANPGAADANVILTLRDDKGATVETESFVIAKGTQAAKFVTELFDTHPTIVRDFTGTLDIKSDVPVAVIGLRFRGANFSTLPATNLSPPIDVPVISGVGGPDAVILAQFATGGGWATEIVIANSGAADLTVRVDLFGQDGSPLVATLNGESKSSFTGILVPKGGVVILAPRNWDGDSDF